jgi:hypothetical protein
MASILKATKFGPHFARQMATAAAAAQQANRNPDIKYTKVNQDSSFVCLFKINAKQPNKNFKFLKLFINNKFVDAKSGKSFETVNPANGKTIVKVAEGDAVSTKE